MKRNSESILQVKKPRHHKSNSKQPEYDCDEVFEKMIMENP